MRLAVYSAAPVLFLAALVPCLSLAVSKEKIITGLMAENVKLSEELDLLQGREDAIRALPEEDVSSLVLRMRQALAVAEEIEASLQPAFWTNLFLLALFLGAAWLALKGMKKKKLPEGQRYLSPSDKFWSVLQKKNPMYITGLTVIERTSVDKIKKLVEERLVRPNERTKMKLVRRYDGFSYTPIWELDRDFHIDRQVCNAPLEGEVTRAQLEEYISKICTEEFPSDRPPWMYRYVEKYESDKSALIFRVDHAVADGVALIAATFNLLDPVNPADAVIGQTRVGQSGSNTFKAILKLIWYIPYTTIAKFLWKADGLPLHGIPLTGKRHVAWSNAIPLEDVKKVKSALGCTINDILMSCVAGGFQRYLIKNANMTAENFKKMTLRAVVPVNVRSAKQMKNVKLENYFSTVVVPLALSEVEPRARLLATKKAMDQLKKEPEAIANFIVLSALTYLPLSIHKFLMTFVANKASMVLTNVPGMPYPVKMGESRVHFSTFWVPSSGELGIGVSIFSFANEVRLGVTLDEAVGKDPHDVITGFEDDFKAYLELVR